MTIPQYIHGTSSANSTDPDPQAAAGQPSHTSVKVVSYGGGVQSTALLVLAARRETDFRTFLFANVGDDSEHPATLAYVREIAIPYAAGAGLEVQELKRRRRDGTTETLMQHMNRPATRSIPIPVRMANGAPGRRNCTTDFKIKGDWAVAPRARSDRKASGCSGDRYIARRDTPRQPAPT
ncbi:hypothetical protein [Nonomuraea sp. NPDC050310]|uniref:hypothetical protein n=1 Tax=Nonomuraea sp. NPDC050310 TaxID=3154935 RepID=UPI0033C109D8